MKTISPNQHEAPTVYRHLLAKDWCREFTWKERFQILFGCRLVIALRVATQWSTGKIYPVLIDQVTKATQPDAAMKQQLGAILVEQKPK